MTLIDNHDLASILHQFLFFNWQKWASVYLLLARGPPLRFSFLLLALKTECYVI